MRLTEKDKIKELETLKKHNVLMTDNDYKELKLGQAEDILEEHNIKTLEELDSLLSYVKQIKSIEEDLHIDLITLFKALKQGNIWVKEHNTEEKEIVCERIRLNVISRTLDFVEPREEIGNGRFLIDYGYSWALTKEELKNE